MALAFAEGRELRDRLARQGALPEQGLNFG
jgi:hypothetical protein